MDFFDIWGDLLLPTQRFVVQDVWQLLLLALVVWVVGRLSKPSDSEDPDKTSPRLWLRRNRGFLTVWLGLFGSTYLLEAAGWSASFFRFFAALGGLWILIGLLSSLLRERFWARSVAFVLFIVTGLHAIAYAEGSIEAFQRVELTVGTLTISAWGVAAGILASLTVLGGAVGLGLGFGLQKVVSNFVSGVILLLDKSIKPGHVIEIPFPQRDLHLRSSDVDFVQRNHPDPD